jgi:hypothetical protein
LVTEVKSEKKVFLDEKPKIQTKKEPWEREENDVKKVETVAESDRAHTALENCVSRSNVTFNCQQT